VTAVEKVVSLATTFPVRQPLLKQRAELRCGEASVPAESAITLLLMFKVWLESPGMRVRVLT
jgi:hypothetical protein